MIQQARIQILILRQINVQHLRYNENRLFDKAAQLFAILPNHLFRRFRVARRNDPGTQNLNRQILHLFPSILQSDPFIDRRIDGCGKIVFVILLQCFAIIVQLQKILVLHVFVGCNAYAGQNFNERRIRKAEIPLLLHLHEAVLNQCHIELRKQIR